MTINPLILIVVFVAQEVTGGDDLRDVIDVVLLACNSRNGSRAAIFRRRVVEYRANLAPKNRVVIDAEGRFFSLTNSCRLTFPTEG